MLPEFGAERLSDGRSLAIPFYWVPAPAVRERLETKTKKEWLLGWRDVTDARTSARTLVASILPMSGVGDNFLLMFPQKDAREVACLLSSLNSLVVDYYARQKVGGLSLKYFTMKQLPILPPSAYESDCVWLDSSCTAWVGCRVKELTYTCWDVASFAYDLGYDGPPFLWTVPGALHSNGTTETRGTLIWSSTIKPKGMS